MHMKTWVNVFRPQWVKLLAGTPTKTTCLNHRSLLTEFGILHLIEFDMLHLMKFSELPSFFNEVCSSCSNCQ